MFISYAQNFEDVMLWRALKHVANGFYIDVGAAWPNEHSVTKAFYDAGWSGINVEPNPAFHALLQQERPRDRNLQLALAEQQGSADFIIFESTGLSTLDPVVAGLHQHAGRPHQTQTVTTSTLAQLWQKYVPEGQEVTAECRPFHTGRSTQVWQTEIRRADGRLACVSRLTTAVIERRD